MAADPSVKVKPLDRQQKAIKTRTATGSVVVLVHEQPVGSIYEVQRFGRPAGHVWLMHTQEGPAWLDIGSDATPSIAEVAAAIQRNHPKCLLTGRNGEGDPKRIDVEIREPASEP